MDRSRRGFWPQCAQKTASTRFAASFSGVYATSWNPSRYIRNGLNSTVFSFCHYVCFLIDDYGKCWFCVWMSPGWQENIGGTAGDEDIDENDSTGILAARAALRTSACRTKNRWLKIARKATWRSQTSCTLLTTPFPRTCSPYHADTAVLDYLYSKCYFVLPIPCVRIDNIKRGLIEILLHRVLGLRRQISGRFRDLLWEGSDSLE